MIKSNRDCWWCGKKLMKKNGQILCTILSDKLGNLVDVHKICANDARRELTQITAQPKEQP